MRRIRLATRRRCLILALFVGIVAINILAQTTDLFQREDRFLPQTVAYAQEPPSTPPPSNNTPTHVDSGVQLDLDDIAWEGETAFVDLPDGRKARLSLNKALTETITKSFDEHPIPYGGAVAIEPNTGRILAIVSASHDKPPVSNYALRSLAPSASVFKLVTAAALLEKGSIDPQARVCYSGGQSMLTESDVRGNPQTDHTCATLEQALGHSINAVIARLAYQHLGREDLERIALKFAFNRQIPTEFITDVDRAEFVDDDIERAKSAAGFWHVNLSPLHGALIAAAIANHGVMMTPTLIDEITDPAGNIIYRASPRPWISVMRAENADTLALMAENTTREGSARRMFASRKGWQPGIRVGGKTGTLSNKIPFYTFNWFVGWAKSPQNKQLAVGALVVNSEKWWIKGSHVAARMMKSYFAK